MNSTRSDIPRFSASLALAAALMAAPSPGHSADTRNEPYLLIELNNLEQQKNACRLSLLIENKLGAAIDNLDFELVLFGTDERIMQLVAVRAGAFPKGKTRVKQFDLKSVECPGIARALLNTITRCDATGYTAASCLTAARTRTRTKTQLSY